MDTFIYPVRLLISTYSYNYVCCVFDGNPVVIPTMQKTTFLNHQYSYKSGAGLYSLLHNQYSLSELTNIKIKRIPVIHVQTTMTSSTFPKSSHNMFKKSRLLPVLLLAFILPLIAYVLFHYESTRFLTPRSFNIVLTNSTQFVPDITLQSYETWHAAQRQCMLKKTCNPPVLIWQCPHRDFSKCAGLGDRMRGIQVAFLLAIITKRVFLIDWPTDPFPIQTVMYPARIDWTMPKAYMSSKNVDLYLDWYSCIKSLPCGSRTNLRFPNFHYLPMRNASVPLRKLSSTTPPSVDIHKDNLYQLWLPYNIIRVTERLIPSAIRALQDNKHLKPYLGSLQHLSSLNIQRLLLQTLFAPSKDVQHRMRGFRLQNTPYIGIHIRNGKDFGEKGNRFKSINQNEKRIVMNVFKCIATLVSNQSAPFDQFSRNQLHLYLASDSTKIKSLFRKYSRQFRVPVHLIPDKAMHISRTKKKDFRLFSARLQSFRNVFVDMFMLARSSVLLGTNSGFSKTSWRFGNSTDYLRIAVENSKENMGCTLTPFNI